MRRPKRDPRPGLDDQRYRDARTELRRIGPHICHTCRYPIDLQLKWPHPLSWSADHKVPRSKLEPNDPRNWHISNLIEAHLRCNMARGAKPIRIPGADGAGTSIDW